MLLVYGFGRSFGVNMQKEMTLSEHAEAWWSDQGNIVPEPYSEEWVAMYVQWHTYAFKDFPD
jgi:hypothetical protein